MLQQCLPLLISPEIRKPQKTANQSSARTMTGLKQDPCGKTRLYVFGFTRNNA